MHLEELLLCTLLHFHVDLDNYQNSHMFHCFVHHKDQPLESNHLTQKFITANFFEIKVEKRSQKASPIQVPLSHVCPSAQSSFV